MSLLGQLTPSYGKDDTVGILRDVDLVLGIGYDSPEVGKIFRSTRDQIVAILATMPEKGIKIRNSLFAAKDKTIVGELSVPISQDRSQGTDRVHTEYRHLQILREAISKNPTILKRLAYNINQEINDYGIPPNKILAIGEAIEKIEPARLIETMEKLGSTLEKVAFLEGCISKGKCLSDIVKYSKVQRKRMSNNKEESMEYWNYNNILSLAQTRQKLDSNKIEGKSFSLSGGSGNTFAQLAIMQKYVEDGGKITSISGTSAGSAMAILVAHVGNDAQKIKILMNDFRQGNIGDNGVDTIPKELDGHQYQMQKFFNNLISRYGLTYKTKFSDLKIPVVVNAGRQYKGGEQEIVLGGDENVMDAIWASQNVPSPIQGIPLVGGPMNQGALGITPVHGVNMIDYAANERGNPTHWLELLGMQQEDLVAIDAGYSSENGGSPFVRRLFQRATVRDFFAKMRISRAGGVVIDIPLESGEGYRFPQGAIKRFFDMGIQEYGKKEFFKKSSKK